VTAFCSEIMDGGVVGELFKEAAKKPFAMEVTTAALKDVETVWNDPEKSGRVVFEV
jgi:hypothetical protein